MDKLLVRLLKLFSPLFKWQGMNTDQLFAIVEVKLKMDKRRTYIQSGAKWGKKKEQDNTNRFLMVLIVYAFLSITMAIAIGTLDNLMLSMIFFHAYLLFMMAMTLITDFSSVMLDTADNQIILPRPVTSKTLSAARLVHVVIYLLQFAIAMCLIPLIVTFLCYGAAVGLACIITIISTIMLGVLLTWLLYMVVLRYSNEQKLKSIISYFQIAMTIVFAVGYQVLPRMINFSEVSRDFSISNYSYIAPPVWMASVLEAVHLKQYDSLHISMILLVLVLPPLLFWVLDKYLAPSFAQKLSMINSDAGAIETAPVKAGIRKRTSYSEKLAPLLCRSSTEQASFLLTWKMTSRDKQFRMQFYPSLAYIFVFIFIFVFRSGKNAAEVWYGLSASNNFLWAIYMPLFTFMSASGLVSYNENYQASWVYYSSPVARPGNLISGAIKAVFAKYFLPVFTGFFIFSLYIWGAKIIDDFIMGFFIVITCLFIGAILNTQYLPFSQQPSIMQQSGKWVMALVRMFFIAIMVGLHYAALLFPVILYVLFPASVFSAWVMIRDVKKTSWEKITR